MIDRQARAELRTRVKNALTEVDRCAAFDPKRADLWEAIRKQLRALDLWMKDDRLPSRENLDQIMVGNIAVRELGDTYEETPPPFRPLREELVIIQDDVMNFYEPFP